MKLVADSPEPPAHLSPTATNWWRFVACERLDRCKKAREAIAEEGMTMGPTPPSPLQGAIKIALRDRAE